MQYRHADRLSCFVKQSLVNALIKVEVRNEHEGEHSVDIDEDYSKHGRHQ